MIAENLTFYIAVGSLIAIIVLIIVELSLFGIIYSLRKEVINLTAKLQEAMLLIFGKKEEQKETWMQKIMRFGK